MQHWEKITADFNARTTNSGKNKKQLQDKLKNLKINFKGQEAANVRSAFKTGGGKPTYIVADNPFNLTQTQVAGHHNPFDSDSTSINLAKDGEEEETAEVVEETAVGDGLSPSTSPTKIVLQKSRRGKTAKTNDAREFAMLKKRKLESEVDLQVGEKEIQELNKKKLASEIANLDNQVEYRKVKMIWYSQDIRPVIQQPKQVAFVEEEMN